MTAEPRKIELVRAVAVAGQVPVETQEFDHEYLAITQLDKQQQPCGQAMRVPHPLLQTLEFPGEATGTMAKGPAMLPSAEFFVRLALHPAAVAVRVEEVAAKVANPVVITFPLTLTKP